MESEKQYSERLSQGPAEAIQNHYTAPRLRESWKLFDIDIMLLKAHAVMLGEEGIITRDHAAAILHQLKDIGEAGFNSLTLRPDLNDLYLNLQMILMTRLGEAIGGRLHTALSRNDFDLAEARLYARERTLANIDSLLQLMEALLQMGAAHAETVMPGYTHHSQAAQPITLGHFLLAHYDIFARDVERMSQAYAVANRSPMGGGALATTGFPINRERVADLVGCDGLVENSLDATGGRDFLLQLGSAVAIAFSNMGRFVESLLVWNTVEFGMISLADKYCHISSIMPQKKNPVALEIIRAESAGVPASVFGAFGVLKAIPVANGREPVYVEGMINECAEKLEVLAPVLADIISTLTIHADVMLEKSRKDFSTMTELADEIVRQTDLAFHQAYVLVGKLVALIQARRATVDSITSDLIDEVAEDVLGERLGIGENAIRRALDPVRNVRARTVTGGPAPQEVRRMLVQRERQQNGLQQSLNARRSELAAAKGKLEKAVADLIANAATNSAVR